MDGVRRSRGPDGMGDGIEMGNVKKSRRLLDKRSSTVNRKVWAGAGGGRLGSHVRGLETARRRRKWGLKRTNRHRI